MNENYIGIAYCMIAIIHLIAAAVRCHVRKDFSEPEATVVLAIAWPITDVQWLLRKWRSWMIVVIVLVGTGGCYPYKDYLNGLPVTERVHNGEAIAIIAHVYGIDYRIPEVRWIVQDEPILTYDGGPALGVTHDCVSWVWWPPLYGPNPRDSTTFGNTVMAHEIAHCAMWLYGLDDDSNTNHTDPVWWGGPEEGRIGGLVGVAMDELIERGM